MTNKKSYLHCITAIIFIISTNLIPADEIKLSFDKKKLTAFQKSLIDDEVTGSNVTLINQNGKTIYHEVVQSGKAGDKNINTKLFSHLSMTKLVTIVAMMILHEQKRNCLMIICPSIYLHSKILPTRTVMKLKSVESTQKSYTY